MRLLTEIEYQQRQAVKDMQVEMDRRSKVDLRIIFNLLRGNQKLREELTRRRR